VLLALSHRALHRFSLRFPHRRTVRVLGIGLAQAAVSATSNAAPHASAAASRRWAADQILMEMLMVWVRVDMAAPATLQIWCQLIICQTLISVIPASALT